LIVESRRLVALSSGALDATLLAPPETGEAACTGLHTLAHMTDLKARAFPMNVIATRRSFLEKNRDVVKRFLQAYGEATYQFMTNKQKALAIYNQRLKQKDRSVVEETYQYFAATFSFPPRVSHEGMRIAIEMLAQRSLWIPISISTWTNDCWMGWKEKDYLKRSARKANHRYLKLSVESLACFRGHRGRTASYPAAPAQIPACSFPAPGSSEILASAFQPKPPKAPTLSWVAQQYGAVPLANAVALR
jgi:NMT1/THI5 like